MRWMVLIAALGLLGAVPSVASAQKAELARYQRAAIRGLGRLEEPAAFEQAFKGKTQEEARASGAQLAARGVVRLSAEDLKYRAELLLDFTGQVRHRSSLSYAFPDPDELFASGKAWGVTVRRVAVEDA